MNELPFMEGLVCPLPLSHGDKIIMGHGSGGKLSHDLVSKLFMPYFDNPSLNAGDDAGIVFPPFDDPKVDGRLAVSTDAHVVWPLFFAGGDIGRLSVCGTVNDVAMMGAKPLYLTAGFILEEGLSFITLQKIIASMRAAAQEAGVMIIAGDTKVVQQGKADGLYITTAGIGIIPSGIEIGGAHAQPGDKVILSGPLGDHGIAVLAARGELGFKTDIQSDIAPLNHLVTGMLAASQRIHVLRDPTRGGLATCLNEIALQSDVGIKIHESSIPVHPGVVAACEMLGFDPLYVANEGKLIAIVDSKDANKLVMAMRNLPYGQDATIIGEVASSPPGRVLMNTTIGSTRVVDVLMGEMLPRIC